MAAVLGVWRTRQVSGDALLANIELGPQAMNEPLMQGSLQSTRPLFIAKSNWP